MEEEHKQTLAEKCALAKANGFEDVNVFLESHNMSLKGAVRSPKTS